MQLMGSVHGLIGVDVLGSVEVLRPDSKYARTQGDAGIRSVRHAHVIIRVQYTIEDNPSIQVQ